MTPVTITRFHDCLRLAIASLPCSALGECAAPHGLDAVLGYACVHGLWAPSAYSADFVSAYKSRLAIDLALRAPLNRLADAFKAGGVPALLLKGEAWARSVYPVAGVRGRCDCDIWVPHNQRERAIGILSDLGIHEVRPYACAGEILTPEALFRGIGLSVDLHWQLSSLSPISRGLDFERCWSTSVPVPDLDGWRMLGPTEALLHAALHLACPGPFGRRWIWALDGLLLLDWAAIDASTLQQRATEAQIADLWEAFLGYAQRLTQPDSLVDTDGTDYRVGQEIQLLLTRAPLPDRLQVLREMLWPREAFLRDRYTDDNTPLYQLQLRRWLDSAKKSARRIRLGRRLR